MDPNVLYLLERAVIALERLAEAATPPQKPSQKPRQAFISPKLEEVQAYCRERGNAVDPQAFMDYYTSVGWKVGNKPMKDWRAAIRSTWEKKERSTIVYGHEGRL